MSSAMWVTNMYSTFVEILMNHLSWVDIASWSCVNVPWICALLTWPTFLVCGCWPHFPAAHDMASADYALMWFSLEHSLLSRLISSLSFSLPLSPMACGSDMITGSFRDKPDTVWTPRSPGEVLSHQTWSIATFCVGIVEDKGTLSRCTDDLHSSFAFQIIGKGNERFKSGLLRMSSETLFSVLLFSLSIHCLISHSRFDHYHQPTPPFSFTVFHLSDLFNLSWLTMPAMF